MVVAIGLQVQTATITVVDPEANRNPTSAETLNAYDETVTLPTIVMGTGGLTLAEGKNSHLWVVLIHSRH